MQLHRLFSRFTVGFRRKNGPLVFFLQKQIPTYKHTHNITSTIPAPENPHTITFSSTKLYRPCFSFICGAAPTFSASFSFSSIFLPFFVSFLFCISFLLVFFLFFHLQSEQKTTRKIWCPIHFQLCDECVKAPKKALPNNFVLVHHALSKLRFDRVCNFV